MKLRGQSILRLRSSRNYSSASLGNFPERAYRKLHPAEIPCADCSCAKKQQWPRCILCRLFAGDASTAVTPEDRDRMIDLCKRIARETDPKKLASWIDELNGLIQTKIRELRQARRAS